MLQFRRIAMAGGSKINTENYLNIEALENGMTVSLSSNACEYCIDADGVWKSLPKATTTPAINAGQIISLRAQANAISTNNGIGRFTISKKCNLSGNVMSLRYGKNASTNSVIPVLNYYFTELFAGTPVVSAHRLHLPSLSVPDGAYSYMFSNCVSLVDPPKISATILNSGSCRGMFNGCSSLIEAPELPATTLGYQCYKNMFKDCTSLTKAPELPAINLANLSECYAYMFEGCTSLINAPALPAVQLASYSYQAMFRYCTSLINAPALPAVNTEWGCYQAMFAGCTSLKKTPIISATHLVKQCYEYMFYNCTSLERVEELPANNSIAFPSGTKMFAGCSKLNYVKALLSIASTEMMPDWMSGVADQGTFVTSRKSQWPVGSSGIPEGWIVEYVD